VIINRDELRIGPTASLFEGADHGGVALSFFLVETEPGNGPALHVHPYARSSWCWNAPYGSRSVGPRTRPKEVRWSWHRRTSRTGSRTSEMPRSA
jgi:hypothetical protein